MFPKRRVLALFAALGLLVAGPSVAVAQSGGAGDDQYQDPFGSGSTGGSKGGGSSNSSGSSTTASTPTPTTQPTSAPAATTAQTGPTLPRTGGDPALVGGAGLTLLLMGVGLRRRLSDERH